MKEPQMRKAFATRFLLAVLGITVLTAAPSAFAAVAEIFSLTGRLSLSVDGGGSNAASHLIQVSKPNSGSTVLRAFVMAATVQNSSTPIADGVITINGSPVNWTNVVIGPLNNRNHLADVTSIVKPFVDAAPAGLINITVVETARTSEIDGEILVVVFDDPLKTANSTVILLFGSQNTTGDTFAITLASPINPTSPSSFLDMGLGITFSAQPTLPLQFSTVDVNTQRVTSSAGGSDDGFFANGALVTVGGIGDTNANPIATAPPTSDRSDDELYSLLPFITASTTSVSVRTTNPSNDDNIMFAYFNISGAAILGEGIVLGPETATNPVGTQHTVTATVVDATGTPVANRTVTFNVISGPNNGATGTAVTNASGAATFTYTGLGGAGTDQIRASFVDASSTTRISNTVAKIWTGVVAQPIPTMSEWSLILMATLLALSGLLVTRR